MVRQVSNKGFLLGKNWIHGQLLVICLEALDSLEGRFVIVITINVMDWKFGRGQISFSYKSRDLVYNSFATKIAQGLQP